MNQSYWLSRYRLQKRDVSSVRRLLNITWKDKVKKSSLWHDNFDKRFRLRHGTQFGVPMRTVLVTECVRMHGDAGQLKLCHVVAKILKCSKISPRCHDLSRLHCEVHMRDIGCHALPEQFGTARQSDRWPILPEMGWLRPKLPERCHPLSTCTEFGQKIGQGQLRFAGLIPERLIFWPKKSSKYRLLAYSYVTDY